MVEQQRRRALHKRQRRQRRLARPRNKRASQSWRQHLALTGGQRGLFLVSRPLNGLYQSILNLMSSKKGEANNAARRNPTDHPANR